MISHDELLRILRYDPDSGEFFWRVYRNNKAYPGGKAGSIYPSGYVIINIKAKLYRAHRLAWFYMTGEWPTGLLDHEDGDRVDNRWGKFRPADPTQNSANSKMPVTNTSGYKGVYFSKHAKPWRAQISLNSKTKNLGYYDTPELAHAAYLSAAQAAFGEFARGA